MGRCVIVAYRPKEEQGSGLLHAVHKHLKILHAEQLITERPGYVMRAADGTILEVFEWLSEEAIARAHTNPAVQNLWAEFGAVCDYIPLKQIPECRQLFAEFDRVEFEREDTSPSS